MYRIDFTDLAIKDLEEIYTYISEEKGAPETADKQIASIYNTVTRLKRFPYAAPKLFDEEFAQKGYRKLIADSYIIVYAVKDKDKTVVVIRILSHLISIADKL